MRTHAAAVLVLVLVSGCGVRTQDGPELLPPHVVPSELQPRAAASVAPSPTSTPTTLTTVPIYLVQGDRIVRENRPAAARTVEDALVALLTADGADGSRRSAVPPGTRVERVEVRGDLLSIEFSAQFAQVRGTDQVLAVAQVVWTATDFPAIRRVDLLVDGRSIELPVERGGVSSGPAGREDYLSVGPVQ